MKMYLTPKTFSLVIVMALTFFSCEKEPVDTLPPATNKGKNTFGCLIDGEPFIAEVELDFNSVPEVSGFYTESTTYFGVQGTRELGGAYENVYVYAYALNGAGTYQISVNSDDKIGYWSLASDRKYYFNQLDPGKVQVTYLNQSKRIIAGTFQFTLVNPAYPDSIMVITDGRFDIVYH